MPETTADYLNNLVFHCHQVSEDCNKPTKEIVKIEALKTGSYISHNATYVYM